MLRYSRSDTELAAAGARDETRAAELRQAAAGAARQRGYGADRRPRRSRRRQANELIDRRTFSWTELFNPFEATLPPDVRITSVRPRVDDDAACRR